MNAEKKICITGGAGFIGTHVVKRFVKKYPDYSILVIDALTYAGNYANLSELEDYQNFTFERVDITDANALQNCLESFDPDHIIHLAAESHVDRSIIDPLQFVKTNVLGTIYLLEAAKNLWKENLSAHLFYHISTDEVYGSLGDEGYFTEETAYDPRSPYSASKASSDHFVRAYHHTYNLPVIVSNCSNNYGSYQFPEKLIPLCINNIVNKKPLPIYGDGKYTRDWLWVEDHAEAIDEIFHKGKPGETYNIGGFNEWQNIDLVRLLCRICDEKLNREIGDSEQLITYIKDRPGHDKRYAIDASKIQRELGWKPSLTFEEGLSKTVDWYLENLDWTKNITSGAYQKYYNEHYA
jgi:dTDP-glucose 4,6-dehydratase